MPGLSVCVAVVLWQTYDYYGQSLSHQPTEHLKVLGKHTHPQLQNPSDIIFFKGKYVATELKRNRLAYFDDLNFTNLQHFDPKTIGKEFRSPHFLAISPTNTLLISNGWGDSIVEIENLVGKGWRSFKGIGDKNFSAPHGLCVDAVNGWIYVGDSLASRVVRFKDMEGLDWQVFVDNERKISYVREMVCENGAVWLANSYEKRAGLNPGKSSNVLKITDFDSGNVEEIWANETTSITGLMIFGKTILAGFWGSRSVDQFNLTNGTTRNVSGVHDLGVPYGMFHFPAKDIYLATFFGSLDKGEENLHGGILSFAVEE